jgi:hypothetical protein
MQGRFEEAAALAFFHGGSVTVTVDCLYKSGGTVTKFGLNAYISKTLI